MVKKAAVLLCSIFVFGSFAVADSGAGTKKEGAALKETKEKAVSMKKERATYYKELDTLIKKYNSSPDKESVKNEMKILVSEYTEKDISGKKEKVAKDKEKTAKLENEIADMEADKESHINKEIDYYLTPEGQQKLNEIREKDEKQAEKKKEAAEKKKSSASKKK